MASYDTRPFGTIALVVLTLLGEFISETLGELCVYQKSVYNVYTSSYNKQLESMECQWGCCQNHFSPCCSAPISLIVGGVIGGVILIAILVVAICCCIFCRRSIHRRASNRNASMRYSISQDPASSATHQTSIVYHSEASANLPISSYVSDLPPSYEEVMRGETNEGFKPDF